MKKLGLRQKLFLYYSLIIFMVILFGFGAVYIYIIERLKVEIIGNMELSVKEMTGQLDNKIGEMDRLTIEVVSNPFIQEYMQDLQKAGIPNSYSDMQNMAYNTLISISAVNLGSLRVSIYNRFGSYISIGIPVSQKVIDSRMQREDYEDWYESIMPVRNSSSKLLPHEDFWSDREEMLSVVREIVDINSYASYGVVETQYPVKKLEELFGNGPKQGQYLVDEQGRLIYANEELTDREEQTRQTELIRCLTEALDGEEKGSRQISFEGNKYYTSFQKSETTGWYFAAVRPVRVLASAVFPVVGVAFLIAAVLLAVMLLFSGLIANRLTSPLKKLQERIRYADREAENTAALPEDEEERDEIHLIDSAFESLYRNLQLSKDELSYVRLQEAKTQMLAVQAQMNPHFLYNILSVISAVSFEYQAVEIMDICKYLSSMLRYAGAFSMDKVRMEEEINHTVNYLELMKCRFKDKVDYEIRVEEAAEEIRVPKLILQPIVENCFKHGLREIKPPWKIVIEISRTENSWQIRVSDNGSGFGKEAVEKLYRQLENWQDNLNDDIASLGIGGYGLANVIIRLKISYGKKCSFKVYDKVTPEGYCTVEIGGENSV